MAKGLFSQVVCLLTDGQTTIKDLKTADPAAAPGVAALPKGEPQGDSGPGQGWGVVSRGIFPPLRFGEGNQRRRVEIPERVLHA